MFNNVLIAEDHESASISIRKTLDEMGVSHRHYVYYCDDALSSIEKRQRDGEPYDLLITDLYFEEDHVPQRIRDGRMLITEARRLQPGLKVLVFSAEHSTVIIEALFKNLQINAYVRKARYDAQELKAAVAAMAKGKTFYPQQLRQSLRQENAHEFTEFDILIISLLSQGMLQKDIPAHLQANQIRPSSLSSLEKRLNLIKEAYSFAKNEQLVAYCKDQHLI